MTELENGHGNPHKIGYKVAGPSEDYPINPGSKWVSQGGQKDWCCEVFGSENEGYPPSTQYGFAVIGVDSQMPFQYTANDDFHIFPNFAVAKKDNLF
ncbi:hypothetical protein BTVI_61730 [Pitangus sulphuratus]|nr:hypothetical protein BTVI_61730 [Pitangus sulphuratus]